MKASSSSVGPTTSTWARSACATSSPFDAKDRREVGRVGVDAALERLNVLRYFREGVRAPQDVLWRECQHLRLHLLDEHREHELVVVDRSRRAITAFGMDAAEEPRSSVRHGSEGE